MKRNILKTLVFLSVISITLAFTNNFTEAQAKKEEAAAGKQAVQSELTTTLTQANQTISELTKKVYSASLFSPKDNDKLINLKLTLYDLWTKNPTNAELAKPLYDTAVLLKSRELYDDSMDLLTVLIENFQPAEEPGEGTFSIDYSSKAQTLMNKIQKETNKQ